jgi:hypothetical protein
MQFRKFHILNTVSLVVKVIVRLCSGRQRILQIFFFLIHSRARGMAQALENLPCNLKP